MPTYEIKVFYSDEGCIAITSDLPGCSAFGKTEDEARKEMRTSVELWLKTAMEQGLM
jgi:predicted RNase H-like HicB family nuclease